MTQAPRRPRDGIQAAIFDSFHDLLGRAPEVAEYADWTAKLTRGAPMRSLREALEASPDHATWRAEGKGLRAIQATGLFDAAWYGRRYPDVVESGQDPLRHYAAHGHAEDRWPNPWFDPVWYRATHGLAADKPALRHYVATGEVRNSRPSPRFDPAWYRAVYNLDAKTSPLADFLRRRRTLTVAPSAELWPALGLPEPALTLVADDVFLSLGEANAAEAILCDAGVFDENYYALHSGDVLSAGLDLLGHYCEFGWKENRQPNFYFDSGWYAETNPDVARLGVNPLAHYLLVGEPEGRRPIVFFDPIWYAMANGLSDDISPLAHFLAHRREGKVSPNQYFDPVYYTERKGERIRPGRDPFARFLVAGLTEDVAPSADFDLATYRKRSMGRVSRHFRHLLDPARDNPLVHFLLSTYR